MAKKTKLSQRDRDLIRRYLVWCYKTTKEELDKIDRYFTQEKVDNFVLDQLKKSSEFKSVQTDAQYKSLVKDFKGYKIKKKENADKKKFADDQRTALNPDYQYLQNRFAAIEKAIGHFLGVKELDKMSILYEKEMTQRILQAREQH